MAGDIPQLEAELIGAFSTHQSALRRWLSQAFPRLGDETEDILQDSLTETLHRVRTTAFRPQGGWIAYLRWVARQRALDRLRSWERRLFRRLGGGGSAEEGGRTADTSETGVVLVDSSPSPPERWDEAERRSRQGLLLSEVLEEFSRWCERRPDRWPIKEAYERSLRGQQPAEIAAGLGLPASEVYSLLNRARTWVLERIRQADVDRSVFLTLHRRKPE